MGLVVYYYGRGRGESGLPPDFQLPAYRKLQHLRIYASPAVARAADEAYQATLWWADVTNFGQDDGIFEENHEAVDDRERALLSAIRADLRIPEIQESGLVAGDDAASHTDQPADSVAPENGQP
jgi:hypothetical protein